MNLIGLSSIASPLSGAGPLVLFLAKATVLLLAALFAAMSLRAATAGARHLVWLAALVGVLALPLLARIDSLRLGVLPSSLAMLSAGSAGAPQTPPVVAVPVLAAPVAAVPAMAPPAMAFPAVPPRAMPVSPADIASMPPGAAVSDGWDHSLFTAMLIVWASVALALIGWLVAGAISVRHIVGTARELTSPDWAMPLCEVADRLDLELPPRLVLSDRTEMAFACRALSPTIVLPAAAESWSDDRRRAVLFHELAHVKRHDLLGHTLGRVACALYWFHPLVWTAAKKLRAESERACDDLVLRCGARPSEYAQHLLDMVTSVRNHGAPIMALPMARKKEFEGRVLAILDPAIRRTAPGPMQTAAVVALLGLLSVTVAAVAPADAAAAQMYTPAAMSVPAVEMSAVASSAPAEPMQADGPAAMPVGQPSPPPRVAGDTTRAALLIRILETDADAGVRRTAAWGLSEMETANVRAALSKAARGDADADVREMAVWALGEQGSGAAASALGDVLRNDKSPRVRSSAAWALGEIGEESAVGALEAALTDSDDEIRHTAIWAIGQLNLSSAPPGVIAALTDKSQNVRLVAAWALGEVGDKAAAPAVIKAFKTETDSTVRLAELRAMAAMDVLSPEMIESALKSPDTTVRQRAVSMLAGNGVGNWPWPWPWPRPRPSP